MHLLSFLSPVESFLKKRQYIHGSPLPLLWLCCCLVNLSVLFWTLSMFFWQFVIFPTSINFSSSMSNDIFKVDGDIWKYQRQVASHEFNTKSLRKFVESVVDVEHGYLVSFSKLEMVVQHYQNQTAASKYKRDHNTIKELNITKVKYPSGGKKH
nr:uncharacterized protein LOC104649220 [Solanum lycopersicum]